MVFQSPKKAVMLFFTCCTVSGIWMLYFTVNSYTISTQSFGRGIPEVLHHRKILVETRKSLFHAKLVARDWWLFMKQQLRLLQKLHELGAPNQKIFKDAVKHTLDHGTEFHSALHFEIDNVVDHNWRESENRKLKKMVRDAIEALQNPSDCSSVGVMTCDLNNPHGFASGLHDALWCFTQAFQSGRRFHLITDDWHYGSNWNSAFLPLSNKCHGYMHSNTVECSFFSNNDDNGRKMLRMLPEDIGPQIIELQGDPLAWWRGQFISYLLRPTEMFMSIIEEKRKKLEANRTLVGLHVRRTDKKTEAQPHELGVYLQHVEEYYRGLELTSQDSIERRVYIATDSPNVLSTCHNKFKSYKCLHQNNSAEKAAVATRYNNDSFWFLILDIYLLSETDYLVCTLSSGFCRLVYELMHGKRSADPFYQLMSLDVPYYYAYICSPDRIARFNHKLKWPDEISFHVDDTFTNADAYVELEEAQRGHIANGFRRAVKNNDNTRGQIPVFKTTEIYEFQKFYPILKKPSDS